MNTLHIYRICEHCNKEFKLVLWELKTKGVNMQDCTHCKKRNDIWIEIRDA